MPIRREGKAKAHSGSSEVTLEQLAETLAAVVDEALAASDLRRLSAAKKLSRLDRLYLSALRRREAGELQPHDPADSPPLTGLRLGAVEQMTETRVALMSDKKVDRERRRLKAAGVLSQTDQLLLAALRERRAQTKNRQKGTP